MSRQWLLLIFVAVLAVIKFVLMPLNSGLDEKREEITKLHERLQKSERLIKEVNLLAEQASKVDEGLRKLKNRFTAASSSEQARLDFQNALEKKANDVGVDLESLEWTTNTVGTPAMSQVDLKVKARLEEFMLFHSDISNLGFGVITTDMRLSVERQLLSRSRLGNVSGQISFRIFYLVSDE